VAPGSLGLTLRQYSGQRQRAKVPHCLQLRLRAGFRCAYAGGVSQTDPLVPNLGAIIRKQRELAELPMRQLAAAVGISNPYLSQIERGLRAPSDAVLNAIAESLRTTADSLYAEAGFVEPEDDDGPRGGLLDAIEAAEELTAPQRRALAETYRAFIDANTVRRSRGTRS
jgi:transcriptional regulator with XRE-family HTH domain